MLELFSLISINIGYGFKPHVNRMHVLDVKINLLLLYDTMTHLRFRCNNLTFHVHARSINRVLFPYSK